MIKYIGRQETIDRYKEEYEKLRKLVLSFQEEQILSFIPLGEWSIKDIIAHLAAWNWEAINEVDRVLKNKATWPTTYESKAGEREFNRRAVERYKSMSWQEVLKDWDNSFWAQIKRMEQLSENEWKYQSDNQFWSDGMPVTVWSLFAYEYECEGHEGGYAKQLRRFFNK